MSNKCKMCNPERYEKVEVAPGRFRLKLMDDTLDISCDLDGENFKIGGYTIYKCPICGRQLFTDYSGSDAARRLTVLDDKGREVGYIHFNQHPGAKWEKA